MDMVDTRMRKDVVDLSTVKNIWEGTMTVKELIKKLSKLEMDKIVILEDGTGGWSNIEELIDSSSTISILPEKYPVFSDN